MWLLRISCLFQSDCLVSFESICYTCVWVFPCFIVIGNYIRYPAMMDTTRYTRMFQKLSARYIEHFIISQNTPPRDLNLWITRRSFCLCYLPHWICLLSHYRFFLLLISYFAFFLKPSSILLSIELTIPDSIDSLLWFFLILSFCDISWFWWPYLYSIFLIYSYILHLCINNLFEMIFSFFDHFRIELWLSFCRYLSI